MKYLNYLLKQSRSSVKHKGRVGMLTIILVLLSFGGCKKFLNVDALDSLSGNNFWQTQSDVEKYTIGIYAQMRTALLSNWLVTISGDWRGGPWIPYTGGPGGARNFISLAAQNNISPIVAPGAIFAGSESTYWGFPTMLITAWSSLYKMVSAANILYAKVDEVPDPAFSESARKKYKAEAVYLRSLAYFYLVRLFGDVPYYTDAYNATSLPKTNQVTIFQNCVNDLGAVVGDLPWTYTDPANIAVRAMRGSALIVMMEMNMWMAGFDNANKLQYWTSTDSLGKELINDNQGAYALLPIDKYPVIFRGKSKEGLVELSQNANYGESGYGFDGRNYNISGYASHNPPGSTSGYSYSYIGSDYMSKLYPQADPDRRKDLWFPTQYIYSGNQMFEFYKYYDFSQAANGSYPIGSLMILRYADAFLLRAEALDDLGQEDEATEMLNMIRQRAGAKLYTSSDDQSLSDAIWYERVKEFMGEGTYFFDLVRTGKILDAKYCPYPIEVEAFYNGAWTWPIPSDAQANNPYLSLNGYWN